MKKSVVFFILMLMTAPLAANFEKGMSLYNQNNYWDAKEQFRKVLTSEKGHLAANAMLAACLYKLRKYDAILSYFPGLIRDRTINLNDISRKKYSFLLLKQIGFACLQTGQSKRAVVALSIASKLISNDPTIYNSLGLAHLKIGNFSLAEISFQTAVHLYPSNYFYRNNLGAAYLELGAFKMALKCFEKAVRMEWNYSNGWDNVWVAREKLGVTSHRGWKSYSYFSTATEAEKNRDKWKKEKEERERKERLRKERERKERLDKEKKEREKKRQRDEKRRKEQEERKRKEAARKKREAEERRRREEAERKKRESAKTNVVKPAPKPVKKPAPKPVVKPKPSSGTNS